MLEIQKHLVEINDLKDQKDPHSVAEMIDLAVLSGLLALLEGADESLVNERYKKFREKSS